MKTLIQNYANMRDEELVQEYRNLVGACKTAEQAMSYWERMGVNIDCPPWTALTTVRDVLLDIEKKQSIINL
jgi:hypothetical protein